MVDYDELKLELKKMRDELALRMHLASMEAKDEWDELEGKWRRFNSQADMGRTAEGVGEAFDRLGEELKHGYRRMRDALRG